MDESFFQQLTDPQRDSLSALFVEAQEGVEATLAEWGMGDVHPAVVENLAFTYYHDWTSESPSVVFLVQDPGPLYDRHRDEVAAIRELGPDPDPRRLIDLHQRFATSWLVRRNSGFTKQFLYTCGAAGLLSPGEDWEGYVSSGAFFDDVYVADVINYRTSSHGETHRAAAYREFLEAELRYVDPDTMFVFGAAAWEVVRAHLDPTPLGGDVADETKVTQAHGYPFAVDVDGSESVVFPLVHFSGQIYHSLLRNSYFDYLHEGLGLADPGD